jgi:hypothetical protein
MFGDIKLRNRKTGIYGILTETDRLNYWAGRPGYEQGEE